MGFLQESWQLKVPCVCVRKIDGRDCVALREKDTLYTTYYFPSNPDHLTLVLGFAIDVYGLPETASIQARIQLNDLTNSIESLELEPSPKE